MPVVAGEVAVLKGGDAQARPTGKVRLCKEVRKGAQLIAEERGFQAQGRVE